LPAHEDHGITSLEEFRRPQQRIDLRIPDIAGFKTLKCDFHMHTVFSDGLVWPHIRVQEAWQEGLDAISITDHIEYQPFAKDIPTNHNRAHELAQEPAAKANILLIPVHYTSEDGVSHLELSNRSDFTFILEKDQGKGGLPEKLRLNPRATRMLAARDILKLRRAPASGKQQFQSACRTSH
jgi:hypothetical protein